MALRLLLLCIALGSGCGGSQPYVVDMVRYRSGDGEVMQRVASIRWTPHDPRPLEPALGRFTELRCRRTAFGDRGAGVECRVGDIRFATGATEFPVDDGPGAQLGRAILIIARGGERIGSLSLQSTRRGLEVVARDEHGARRQRLGPRAAPAEAVRVSSATLGALHRAGFRCDVDVGWVIVGAPYRPTPGEPVGHQIDRLRCATGDLNVAVSSWTTDWRDRHARMQDHAELTLWQGADPAQPSEMLTFEIRPASTDHE